jgi:polyisoprenoid-binding protein YceI
MPKDLLLMKKLLAAGAMTALLSLAAVAPHAMAQPVASQDPNTVKAGTYKIEPNHTQIGFSVSHMGFTNFLGLFSGASGTLQLDPAKSSAAKLQVSVSVQTVLTTAPALDDELRGDKWFDVAHFPTATFTSTKVTPTGKGTATITGDLTLHGVTKPVTLKARFFGAGVNPLDKAYTTGFEATGTIKRGDFGIKTYLPLIGDDVQLTISGAFELQQ